MITDTEWSRILVIKAKQPCRWTPEDKQFMTDVFARETRDRRTLNQVRILASAKAHGFTPKETL